MDFRFADHSHRRHNPLTGQWVLVSPQRTKRPWSGKTEPPTLETRPSYDPECYLCPGNKRAGGIVNPAYEAPFVFTNDFSALLEQTPDPGANRQPLFGVQKATGTCRVICFSPKHNLTLPLMSATAIGAIVDVWADQTAEMGKTYRWVQIFENKGDIMGCSNPHPHGQIWASSFLPNEPFLEDARQLQYYAEQGAPLLLDYAEQESRALERIVVRNDHWIAVVPFWAVWPYETMLLPLRHVFGLDDLSVVERAALADILKRLLTKYDNLFSVSFPYSFGWHQAPRDASDRSHWQSHAHFYPPLLRSSSIKKFMVGYELLAETQRDLTAEQAAERLKGLSEIHYASSPKE